MAYSEGYEAAQKEFNSSVAKSLNNKLFKEMGKRTNEVNTIYNKSIGRKELAKVADPLAEKVSVVRRFGPKGSLHVEAVNNISKNKSLIKDRLRK